MVHINLKVEGITCGGCEKSIRNALLSTDGVNEAGFDVANTNRA